MAVFLLAALGTLLPACAGPSEPEQTPNATSLSVTPSSATATALEDTTSLSATVRDQSGNTMSGVTIDWSSSDDSVATVSSAGKAIARANGTVEVVAAAEGLADSASLTVEQEARQVTVSPGADTLAVDDSARLSAEARDANDHPLTDSSFEWSSSDTAVATVDSTGLLRAEATGAVKVVAAVDGVSDTSSLQVHGDTTGGSSEITSVTSPLPETRQATIQGSGFSATPDSNVVEVNGMRAVVDQAASTELTIVVPDLGCVPAGTSVDVTVTVSGQTADPYAVATDPEEPPVSVSSGTQTIRTDSGNLCLQFPESSDSSRYLIGVQSLSSAVGTLTPVRVEALTPGWNTSTDYTANLTQLSASPGRLQTESESRAARIQERHNEAEVEIRRWERENLDLSADMLSDDSEDSPRVYRQVADPSVGDTLRLRVPDFSTSDACDNYVTVIGVVKEIGTEGIIVADTAAPTAAEGGYTSQDYQDFSDGLDRRFPALENYFGTPTDIDSNGRVAALFTPATSVVGNRILGFVWRGDLMSRSTCPSSSEGEIFYGRVPAADYPVERLRHLMPATIQHELTHVVQVSRRGDYLEPYLSEAQASLAEEISGHMDAGREPYENYGASIAWDSDRSDRGRWYSNDFDDVIDYFGYDGADSPIAEAPQRCGWWREEPSPCTSRPLWYGVGWSFLRWVSDTYGPTYSGGEEQLHQDIITDSGTGIQKVMSLVGSDVSTLMARWAAALYLDDRASGLQDDLTFSSWDLYDIIDQNKPETAHLKPMETDFSTWYWETDIRASSTAYLLVSGTSRPNTALSFSDQTGAMLPSDMQVWMVRVP